MSRYFPLGLVSLLALVAVSLLVGVSMSRSSLSRLCACYGSCVCVRLLVMCIALLGIMFLLAMFLVITIDVCCFLVVLVFWFLGFIIVFF